MIFGPYKKGDTFYGIIILYLGKNSFSTNSNREGTCPLLNVERIEQIQGL